MVGGRIQVVYAFDDDAVIICNDEGKLEGLARNRALTDSDGSIYDVIVGNFFVISAPEDSDDFASLTEKQVEFYLEKYSSIHLFDVGQGKLSVTSIRI